MSIELHEEEEYLEGLKKQLEKEADEQLEKMGSASKNCMEVVRYLWEGRSEFDEFGYEAFNHRQILEGYADSGEEARKQFKRLVKMLDSPYFARINFQMEEEPEPLKVYIGKFPFWNAGSDYEVYDWRAPIASMYYEFEGGQASQGEDSGSKPAQCETPAYYDAPGGRICGMLSCKRQYKIRRGELQYVLESSLSINDEILQKELSRSSDHKMRDIVSTIQKEQNQLIRNESAEVLIIQGVAGSGKTSIALHRIAYFLYRYKNEVKSENFLIISPNGVFVDYISNVLPELGEETVKNIGMEDIADKYLGTDCRYERLSDQTERYLLAGKDDWLERSRFKATAEYLRLLEDFLRYCDEHYFIAVDYEYGGGCIDSEFIYKCYIRLRAKPVQERLREVADAVGEEIKARRHGKAVGARKIEILEWLKTCFRCLDPMALYEDFYWHIGRAEMFRHREEEPLEAADIFPLIYVKLYLEGGRESGKIKHLILDEMQDYTPVQYAVLNQLYPCRKTILGDFSQNVMPFARSSMEFLEELYPGAQVMKIYKSYRSTCEIMEFARKIRRDVYMEPVQRHGREPELLRCADAEAQREELLRLVDAFLTQAGDGKLGIICKSYVQAQELYWWLAGHRKQEKRLHLFTSDSEEFYDGIMVTSVSMAKGLEFDEVVVPDVDKDNYASEYDRGLLYVACTRAMHRLTLLYWGEASLFLG